MDALTYLALTAKAKLVFETPGTFMSFPALSPVSYTADQLSFGAFNSTDNGERQVYSEFARLANAIPTHTIFEMGDQFLWDSYASVLRNAILAHGQVTPEDTAAYQKAVSFLNVTDASGISTASPQLLAYRQFRDAWFLAVQNYKTQQGSAAALTDANAVSQWQTIDEPRLRALVEQARIDWQTKGFKKQVEDAQQVEQAYAARSPELIWHDWSALFDPDIDLQTDPAQQQFAPTSFVPADIFSQDWPTFNISGAEVTHLVERAPAELKDIFATEGAQPNVDALSFEYRSVALARHWFKPDVFNARFWRLAEGSEPLSDGGDPPKGSCPAYIVALVFMRNIQVTMHTDHPVPQVIRTLPALRYVAVKRPGIAAPMRLAPMAIAQPLHASPLIEQPVHPSPQIATMHARPITLTPQHFAVRAPVRPAPGSPALRAAIPITVVRRVDPGLFHSMPQPSAPPSPPPQAAPVPTPPPVAVTDPKKDISILAFICRPLPKTPNPDPDLIWDDKPSS
jgi:hypothetical protein